MKNLFLVLGWVFTFGLFSVYMHDAYVQGPENQEKLISVIEGKFSAVQTLSLNGTQGAYHNGLVPVSRDHFERVLDLAAKVNLWDSRQKELAKEVVDAEVLPGTLELSDSTKATVISRVTLAIREAREQAELKKLEVSKIQFLAQMEAAAQECKLVVFRNTCEKEELRLKLQEIDNKQLAAEIESLKLLAEKDKLTGKK